MVAFRHLHDADGVVARERVILAADGEVARERVVFAVGDLSVPLAPPHFLLLSPPSSRCTDDGVANNDLLWLLFVIMKVLAVLGVGKKLFLLLNIF